MSNKSRITVKEAMPDLLNQSSLSFGTDSVKVRLNSIKSVQLIFKLLVSL